MGQALTQEAGAQARGALQGVAVQRITFTEVTQQAVQRALSAPRSVSQALVDAYLGRRALDYLYGFTLSPLLWRKLPGSKSAGGDQCQVALQDPLALCHAEQSYTTSTF